MTFATLRRPTPAAIDAVLGDAARPFGYQEVGATSYVGAPLPQHLAARYDVDHHLFAIGRGRDTYARARRALAQWRHFEIPWLELHGARGEVAPGQTVATLVRVLGVWLVSPCRVVHAALDEGASDVASFAYGTLRGHPLRGEERFTVAYDPATNEVTYEIAVFSAPEIALARLGRPFARRLQRRFVAASARALARAASPPR